jgi:hypothetical protein
VDLDLAGLAHVHGRTGVAPGPVALPTDTCIVLLWGEDFRSVLVPPTRSGPRTSSSGSASRLVHGTKFSNPAQQRFGANAQRRCVPVGLSFQDEGIGSRPLFAGQLVEKAACPVHPRAVQG